MEDSANESTKIHVLWQVNIQWFIKIYSTELETQHIWIPVFYLEK